MSFLNARILGKLGVRGLRAKRPMAVAQGLAAGTRRV